MYTPFPKLDVQVTHNLGAGDVTWRSVFSPGSTYLELFESGGVSDLTWPNGCQDLNAILSSSPLWTLNGGIWESSGGPYTIRPNYFDSYGVVEWSIDAGPGHVPGKLHVGLYLPGSAENAPDSLTEYDLGSGGWSTGPLPVSAAEFAPDQYYDVRIRFVPEHLQSLL